MPVLALRGQSLVQPDSTTLLTLAGIVVATALGALWARGSKKTKKELLEDAREAGIPGRSKMDKDELVEALQQHNDRATARARGD